MLAVIPSTEIAFRTDFSLLCNARGYRYAVEVGVETGRFAADFLARWEGTELVLVDDYADRPEYPGNRTMDAVTACLALQPWHGKVRWLGLPSTQAARRFPSWIVPDFVYLDASHDLDSVSRDIAAWWGVLSPTGLLAGHDYREQDHAGVVVAVNQFAKSRGLTVRLTHEDLPSWYIYRQEPEHLYQRLFTTGDGQPNPHYPK